MVIGIYQTSLPAANISRFFFPMSGMNYRYHHVSISPFGSFMHVLYFDSDEHRILHSSLAG